MPLLLSTRTCRNILYICMSFITISCLEVITMYALPVFKTTGEDCGNDWTWNLNGNTVLVNNSNVDGV